MAKLDNETLRQISECRADLPESRFKTGIPRLGDVRVQGNGSRSPGRVHRPTGADGVSTGQQVTTIRCTDPETRARDRNNEAFRAFRRSCFEIFEREIARDGTDFQRAAHLSIEGATREHIGRERYRRTRPWWIPPASGDKGAANFRRPAI